MPVKSADLLSYACLSLPLAATADSSPNIAHKAILDPELPRTRFKDAIAALPSQAQP
ncbi:hypothetical protein [Pseudomonas sp. MWU13-2105]|uniref:hypothetical protein n=1 Tax=Pseudomonas sp. MWU13-2105 TaxID=2935074 RepID=UPI002010B453|nr:hypothetical protein [Pseudomonas sp. MWU13-2105]